ncbi:MAG: GspL/Epsl periplasmic domain-containing protein [Candidatus Deferrimicrobiota bacterium]
MKSLGVSISRDRISALLWEQTLFSSRVVFSCAVPCGEPYGGFEGAALLAEEIRKGTGEPNLPPVVLSLPPSWTYLRQVELPVPDLQRAKKIHVADLEGNLPIEDEQILSDLMPSPPGHAGRFLAVAARKDTVEKSVASFSEAGFRVDRVVTDHASILSAVLSVAGLPEGILLSTLSDIVVLRVEGGAVSRARQFPAGMASDPEGMRKEWEGLAEGGTGALPVTILGEVPAPLSEALAAATRFTPPAGVEEGCILAYGAVLTPSWQKELGGFSLRTSAEAESERDRTRLRVRVAAIAAGVAAIFAVGTLEVAQWAEAKKVAIVRAQIRKEFSEAVPGVKVVVQETAQIREKIQSLRRHQKELGADSPALSVLLARISQALPPKANISVREISFDAGRVRLAGEAGSAQFVETFRSSLATASGPEAVVTVQESRGSAKGGSVRFTILIEKGSNGRAS